MTRLREMLLEGETDKLGSLPITKREKALIDLFSSGRKVKDHKDIHKLSEELNIATPSELEEDVYKMLTSFWSKGRAMDKKFDFTSADPKEVKMGMEVEKEHTDNKYMAYRIAIDHLAEMPNYYTELAKMEKEGGVKE